MTETNRSAGALPTSREHETADAGGSSEDSASHGRSNPATGNKTLSTTEQLYRQQYNSSIAQSLTQYGYSLFNTTSQSISRLAVPGPDYLVGPGDTLHVRFWGSGLDTDYTGVISKEGTLSLPNLGVIPLAGTPLGKLEGVILREAEKYTQGVNINVALSELRSMEIYVVGEVERPGLHLIQPFSTVLNGLITGGGVKKSGSLRNISLVRDGVTIQTIDLYSLLLKGSRDADVVLKDGDVLFVPRLGHTAAIAGAAAQPAIYELAGETSVADLLQLAGGALPQSFTVKMLLRRFNENQEFVVSDLDSRAKDLDLAQVAIRNGDLLELQFVDASWPQVIRLQGNVWAEDVFTFRPGLQLSDILTGPELFKPDTITDFALLHRYDVATTRYRVERFPLKDVMSGSYNTALNPYDRIEILSRTQFNITEPVKLVGSVWQPGEYIFTPGLTLADLIGMSGGFKFDADSTRLDLSRQIINNGSVSTVHQTLSFKDDGAFQLQPYDYVYVRQIRDAASFKSVSIGGEVRFPGSYRIKDGERLSDLIERAGGFTENAYFHGAYFTSEKARELQQTSINDMVNDLEVKVQSVLAEQVHLISNANESQPMAEQQALTGLVERLRSVKAKGRINITLAPLATFRNSVFDFELRDGDTLTIPEQPNFVSVVGSVYSANSFLYQTKYTLEDYLALAGGPTKTADADNIYLMKANGEVVASSQSGMFSSFGKTKMMPGDTIVVPEDLERIPALKLIRDISDIVFKIATTAGIAFAI
ncbi:MAG: SLBB domain-containing protein [Proteobacteria bacterium]|nr:SLBB domain-containing protein [Pseudomonadota bacterium]MBU1738854.1 SLBB domain-containing protein [Pseudomonadota bacterium]